MRIERAFSIMMASLLVALAPPAAQQAPAAGLPPMASEDPCATAPVVDEVAMAPFTDRMLIPDKPFDLNGIAPETMAKMSAMVADNAKQRTIDWPALCRYRQQNAAVVASGVRPQVVFLGDSITEFWKLADPELFSAAVLDRGISGQTTPQILLRFQADVVALHPRVVHIMAGTNDIAGNTGPASNDMIIDNIRAMLDLAKANGIKVVLASITPVAPANRERPLTRILALNVRLRALAAQRGAVYLDYYAKLTDGRDAIDPRFANDGLHPNRAGYAVMRPLAERAIAQTVR